MLRPIWRGWGYERALRADTRQADLSLSLFISCLACNHPVSAKAAAWLVQCRINILARIQAWSVGSLILSDRSCITENVLIAFLTEGCLKVVDEGMGLYHRRDLSDALRIDLGWSWLINGVLVLLLRSTRIGFSQLLFPHCVFSVPCKVIDMQNMYFFPRYVIHSLATADECCKQHTEL